MESKPTFLTLKRRGFRQFSEGITFQDVAIKNNFCTIKHICVVKKSQLSEVLRLFWIKICVKPPNIAPNEKAIK